MFGIVKHLILQSHTGIDRVLLQSEVACLPLHMETLPEALQQYGYATHLVGKWHLGMSRWECLPNQRGFNSFLGKKVGTIYLFFQAVVLGSYDVMFAIPNSEIFTQGVLGLALDNRVCTLKLIPTFRCNFGRNVYPCLGVVYKKKIHFEAKTLNQHQSKIGNYN